MEFTRKNYDHIMNAHRDMTHSYWGPSFNETWRKVHEQKQREAPRSTQVHSGDMEGDVVMELDARGVYVRTGVIKRDV